MSENKTCPVCNEEIPEYYNYCDSRECWIELAKRAGGVAHTPNNLPIACIRADNTMLEHEHGDHPDYLFPVDVEYTGPKDESRYELCGPDNQVEMMDEGWRYMTDHETHSLVYANTSVAVTMYETCTAVWLLQDETRGMAGAKVIVGKAGRCLGGHLWEANEWKISEESLAKIKEYVKKKFHLYLSD